MKRMISIIGIFHIIYGALSLLYLGFFLILLYAPQTREENPILYIIKNTRSLQIWYVGISIIDFIVALLIIISGAGLLMSAYWGKITTVGFVMYNILSNIVRNIISSIFIVIPLWQEAIVQCTDEIIGGITITIFLMIGSFLVNIIYSSLVALVIINPDTAKLFRK